ncbi:MAG: prolyl oligopeptidase family serine peptidase, partial [Akkermansiaceae bacterium]|nr:prolyl oligopeptidase family serine peptidase [Akkermansiaceae bacterium]
AGATASNPVPGIVLVHGGGGTAFRDWVQQWYDRGYAAISIAVEGQTDVNDPQGGWVEHQWPGPSRVGIYQDSDVEPFEDQWMYHAVADTVLANSLMRARAAIDPANVGVMGISWGGVITSTVMGVDNRFAFAIPMYGCGDLADARNVYGTVLTDNQIYRQVLDPMVRLHRATMPSFWFSWNEDFHFPLDSQAACYHRAAGPHMMSAVPNLLHGHIFNRPEPFAFADSIVNTGSPWLTQRSLELENGIAEVVFESTRTLDSAVLTYTTGNGHVGDLTWPEIAATLVQNPDGSYTASAALPANATAWYINVLSGGEYASSDYQEINKLTLHPTAGLYLFHSLEDTVTSATAKVEFTGPTHADVIRIEFIDESHPGAFTHLRALPWMVENPAPARGSIDLQFDNSVAGLTDGQSATATLRVTSEELDGTVTTADLPVGITALAPRDVIYTVTSNWSSKFVTAVDDVIIRNDATVTLDQDQLADSLVVNDENSPVTAALQIAQDFDLTLANTLRIGTGTGAGTVAQSAGAVSTPALAINSSGAGDLSRYHLAGGDLRVEDDLSVLPGGELVVDGGVLTTGATVSFTSGGRIEVRSGRFDLNEVTDPATSLLQFWNGTLVEVSGGTFNQYGQMRLGQTSPAEFRIVGDAGTINLSRITQSGAFFQGVFNFVFDQTGVSTVHSDHWLVFEGGRIEVDGAGYAGGPATFTLFDSPNFVSTADPAKLNTTGFNLRGLEAAFVQDQAADLIQLVLQDHVAGTVIYDVTSNWSSQEVFSNDDVIINTDAVVTLDENAAGATLVIGNQSGLTGELLVGGDFSIDISGALTLGAGGGSGTVTQFDGSVGAASLAVNAGGLFAVSGGTVATETGPDTVGTDGPGEFRVVGADAVIQLSQLSQPGGSQGTFRFVLGASGISPVHSAVSMDLEGALIAVDGSAYTGGSGVFTLFDSPSLVTGPDGANITISGFDAQGLEATAVVINGNRVELIVDGLLVNGVPRSWMAMHGLPETDEAALADADGDGAANWEEYFSGTDPNDPGSFLRITNASLDGDQLTVFWSAVAGKTYKVQYKEDLRDTLWTEVATGVPGVEPEASHTFTITGPLGFFRIGVE